MGAPRGNNTQVLLGISNETIYLLHNIICIITMQIPFHMEMLLQEHDILDELFLDALPVKLTFFFLQKLYFCIIQILHRDTDAVSLG